MQPTNTIDLGLMGTSGLGAFTPSTRKPTSDFGAFINRAETQTRENERVQEANPRPADLQATSNQKLDDHQRADERDSMKATLADERANQRDVERGEARRLDDRAADDKFAANRDAQKRDEAGKPSSTPDKAADKPVEMTKAQASEKPTGEKKTGDTKDPTTTDSKPAETPSGIAVLGVLAAQAAAATAVATNPAAVVQGATTAEATAALAATAKGANPAVDALAKTPVTAAGQPVQLDAATLAKAAQAAQTQATQAQVVAPVSDGKAQATVQAAVPDMLLQAAGALGPIKVQVEGTQKPANLAIQILEDHAQTTVDGPIAPVTTLDGAASTGISSLIVDLPLAALKDHEADLPDAAQPDAGLAAATSAPVAEHKPVTDVAAPPKDAQESTQAHDVARQVMDQADRIKVGHQNSVKLQLMPEHLGKMEIRVVSHNGVISAQLSADTQSAKSMLESQVANLQRSFADMGLKVDKVEVTLSSANLDFAGGGSNAFAGFDGGQQGQAGQQAFAQAPRMSNGLGYEQWIGDTASEEQFASAERDTAINYVA